MKYAELQDMGHRLALVFEGRGMLAITGGIITAYYPGGWFQTGQAPTPDPDPVPEAPKSLRTQHEDAVLDVLNGLPPVRKYMLYKQLFAEGIRLSDCGPKIRELLAKEAPQNS